MTSRCHNHLTRSNPCRGATRAVVLVADLLRLFGDVSCPPLQEISTLLKKVCAPVCALHFPANRMTQRSLRHLIWRTGRLSDPVAQAGTKAVWTSRHFPALHQPRHGGVGNHALLDVGKEKAISGKRFCLLYKRESFGHKRNTKVGRFVLAPLLLFPGNRPDVSFDLLKA